MLQSICKATQMGICGIEAVKQETCDRELLAALESQQREYQSMHAQADHLLHERGRMPTQPAAMLRQMSGWSARMRARLSRDPVGAIAQMTLLGNTRGMMKSLHKLHRAEQLAPEVSALSERLLKTEQANIEQMKKFL